MSQLAVQERKRGEFKNSTFILFSYATAFFPRLLTYFGGPDPLNFIHLFLVPIAALCVLFTTKVKDRKQIEISWQILIALGIFVCCMLMSALVNDAGLVNVLLQLMLFGEPFFLLLAVIAVPLTGERLDRFRRWLIGFAAFNLVLALAQSVLIPAGIYPRRGGTIADNIAGVFASGAGSAGNYVSCTVSIYFSAYALMFMKAAPLWLRIGGFLGAIYQTQVSDSKQVFLALMLGLVIVLMMRMRDPLKLLIYIIVTVVGGYGLLWVILNVDAEFLAPYRNWVNRAEIYGPEGEATLTKLAAFRLIPPYFDSFLNWLFGLGPGHTVTRLGGWMLPKYAAMLKPVGATVHPVSGEVFQVVKDGWIAQESTIFFPMFTWAGLWGDFGLAGLSSYVYLGYMTMKRICVDDLGRFMMMSTAVLGFILTQMEEPGHTLTIAMILGLRWHEMNQQRRAAYQHFSSG